jgi:hypothetical protein
MRQCGWQVSFRQASPVLQITLSSVKLYFSLSEGDCFYALWNETLIQSLSVFYASIKCLIENKLPCFWRLYNIFVTGISWGVDTKQPSCIRVTIDPSHEKRTFPT